jgi:hypothetical protein
MLHTWLRKEDRGTAPGNVLAVTDIQEFCERSDDIGQHLSHLVREARFDAGFLASMAEQLGWSRVRDDIITRAMSGNATAKRGEFGEVLVSGILEEFDGYIVPVRKMRFKITPGQSLPATDMLGLALNTDGNISEVLYVESKLRTTRDDMVAVDGYKQLQNDYSSKLPDMLTFVANRLYEWNHPLYESFRDYMGDRLDNRDKDGFCLSLCFDTDEWQERALVNLEDYGISDPTPRVFVIRLSNLRALTDEVFAGVGVTEVIDDD